MGSTTGGDGGGLDFSISPEQRARDTTAEQWSSLLAEALSTPGIPDSQIEMIRRAAVSMNRGGFDIGEAPLGQLQPEHQPMKPLQLQPEHLTLQYEDHLEPKSSKITRHKALEELAKAYGIHDQSQLLTATDENETAIPYTYSKGRIRYGEKQARIGEEFGVEPTEATRGTAAAAATAETGGVAGMAGMMGTAVGGVYLAQDASNLAKTIMQNPFSSVMDSLFNPGHGRHGSIKQVLDAAQTDALANYKFSGRSLNFFRHPHDNLFPPKQHHN